ncbi:MULTISPECIES: hypothetical protein [unclassified Kitasatospora]|uniref:hypothetical protein n=1 Tax=unclassified Kitasatospora TaxID=2633591 RepID=UPI000709BA2E|nr:hypothetical protein ASC99_09640 [Kitasatospora sp. Root107]KRB76710.1 hypothetical protein ASE03_13740 [Kitasatospora sp. Root187]
MCHRTSIRPHGHPHEHRNEHHHDHSHGPSHRHGPSHLLRPHSHDAADRLDSTLESPAEGLRTLWISLVVLALTAGAQAVVVALSGAVALLVGTCTTPPKPPNTL